MMLLLVALLLLARSASLAAAASPPALAPASPGVAAVVLIAVDGMICTSCARGIQAMLKRTEGVLPADVSYERREARVEYDPDRTSPGRLVEAITNMGYSAKVKQ